MNQKLSRSDIEAIGKLTDYGVSIRTISKKLKISKSQVQRIQKREGFAKHEDHRRIQEID